MNVVWAANHWQAAVDAHAVKPPPDTAHARQDLQPADYGHAHERGKTDTEKGL